MCFCVKVLSGGCSSIACFSDHYQSLLFIHKKWVNRSTNVKMFQASKRLCIRLKGDNTALDLPFDHETMSCSLTIIEKTVDITSKYDGHGAIETQRDYYCSMIHQYKLRKHSPVLPYLPHPKTFSYSSFLLSRRFTSTSHTGTMLRGIQKVSEPYWRLNFNFCPSGAPVKYPIAH